MENEDTFLKKTNKINKTYIIVIILLFIVGLGVLAFISLRGGEAEYVSRYGNFNIVRQGILAEGSHSNSIIIGADGVTGNVSPLNAITEADLLASGIIFEALLEIGATGAAEPLLAESFYISNNGLTYTFNLREDIYFSDGTPLRPEDILESMLSLSEIGAQTPHSLYLSRIIGFIEFRMGLSNSISGITADNENNSLTVTFETDGGDNIRAFLSPVFRDGLGTGPISFPCARSKTFAFRRTAR